MRISLVECEKLQYNVFSGKVDLQDILDILCMPLCGSTSCTSLGRALARLLLWLLLQRREAEEADKMSARVEKESWKPKRLRLPSNE